jgi:GGDEF domain-containing protein
MSDEAGSSARVFSETEMRHLLGREILRGTRYQDFLSLYLIRLAPAGNAALREAVAREIAEMLRFTDLVGLIDEDIAVILVHTPSADAVAIGERIRERVEATTFSLITPSRVALRMGLACFPTDATAEGALLAHAHAQLAATSRPGA